MPTIRHFQIMQAGIILGIAFLLLIVAKNYSVASVVVFIIINILLSALYINSYQWDIILAAACLYLSVLLMDPIGLILIGQTPIFGGHFFGNISQIVCMAALFFCSYLSWLVFKLKYDNIISPNQADFIGFDDRQQFQNYRNSMQNNNIESNFVPWPNTGPISP